MRLGLALGGVSIALCALPFAGPLHGVANGALQSPSSAAFAAAAPPASPPLATTAPSPSTPTPPTEAAAALFQPMSAPIPVTIPAAAASSTVSSKAEEVAPGAESADAQTERRTSRLPEVAWFRSRRETALWSGPDHQAVEFSKLPSGTLVVALEVGATRTFAFVSGDGDDRKAGEVWIDTTDLEPTAWPRWARGRRPAAVRAYHSPDAEILTTLKPGTFVEVVGEPIGSWAKVFYLGDGRIPEPIEGWVVASDFGFPATAQATLSASTVTRATLAASPPEVWLRAPYLTQLDGSAYAQANCGPTSVGMILEALGKNETLGGLRATALELQGTPRCNSCGLFIQTLAGVAQDRGATIFNLHGEGDTLRRWNLDEIRLQIRDGRFVVPQVMYRRLPGRENSGYWGDHYVVVTGILGDQFIYNDPLNHDANGYGRVISGEMLQKAMAESDFPFAAFAVGR